MRDNSTYSPKVGIGLESTVDIVITFPKLENFEDFAESYEGELSDYVEKGYEIVSSGSDGEVPIDGKEEEAERMLGVAREEGAEIEYRLGGNAAHLAVTFQRLGADTIFLGGIFPDSLSKISSVYQESLRETDNSFARVFDEYAPASYVLQAHDADRYILCEGEGRRIEQLRLYIGDLPETVQEVSDKYEGLDVLSLVGWQVLFSNELREEDYELLVGVIEEIRSKTDTVLFTDARGIGGLNREEKERLWEIYSKFDILSVNEGEVSKISKILSLENTDKPEKMLEFLKNGDNLSTVWLHTPYYQISISEEFSRTHLEEAQKFSTSAGLYKVEKGSYPSEEELSEIQNSHEPFQEGLEKRDEIRNKYGKTLEGRKLVTTPCFEEKKFFSKVGAGSVSSATYLHTLAQLINKDK